MKWCLAAALALSMSAGAADFATPGGPPPANVGEVASVLQKDGNDLELMISFGTSKGGSAGHLALAIRGQSPGDEMVYSANFYADRSAKHEKTAYTRDLMVRIPKMEYLYGTSSSLGDKASFGLDFGEIYKRSVVGIRVYGVPASEKEALAAFFARMNDDYHKRVKKTEYHDREVKYDYLQLNCAKTIGSAFRHGAGYRDLEVTSAKILPARTNIVAAMSANIPAEMAMKLVKEWGKRGYRMDVVLYRKYAGSAWFEPDDSGKVAFKDLPNRFPSVISRDFRKDQGRYEDHDNLYAMYLLYNMGKYIVLVNGEAKRLEIDSRMVPLPYAEAAELAARSAKADSENFGQRLKFVPKGTPIEDVPGGS